MQRCGDNRRFRRIWVDAGVGIGLAVPFAHKERATAGLLEKLLLGEVFVHFQEQMLLTGSRRENEQVLLRGSSGQGEKMLLAASGVLQKQMLLRGCGAECKKLLICSPAAGF